MKPTPRLSEVTSVKRTRAAPRSAAPKRKLLIDDTMVLHGEYVPPFFLLMSFLTFCVCSSSTLHQELRNFARLDLILKVDTNTHKIIGQSMLHIFPAK